MLGWPSESASLLSASCTSGSLEFSTRSSLGLVLDGELSSPFAFILDGETYSFYLGLNVDLTLILRLLFLLPLGVWVLEPGFFKFFGD